MTTDLNSEGTTRAAAKPAQCPQLEGYDPLLPDQNANPFALLARARRETPVFYLPKYALWVVTRREDALKIYRDLENFSNVGRHDMRVPIPDELRDQVPEGWKFPLFLGQLAVIDPPQHTRIRKLMQKAFTPKHIGQREAEIREIANGLIDGFIDDGHAELVDSFASPIPVNVIARILGVPEEHTAQFRTWADDFFILATGIHTPHEEIVLRWSRLLKEERFVRTFIDERRAKPQDDLTSDLILAKSDDGSPSLTDDELLANLLGLVLAGTDTTAILIGHAVYALLTHPEQWQRLKADRSLVPKALEETMRWLGPLRGGIRVAKNEVEVGGYAIPPGGKVFIHQGSVNRDEAHFDDPDEFEIGRANAGDQLGFGIGLHYCLGAPLAKLEAKVALECLIDRLPTLRLAPSLGPLEYTVNLTLPSLRTLDVEWG